MASRFATNRHRSHNADRVAMAKHQQQSSPPSAPCTGHLAELLSRRSAIRGHMASLAVLDDDDGTLEPPLRRSSRWLPAYAAMQRRSALFSCAFYVDSSMLAERHDGHRLQSGSASDDPLVGAYRTAGLPTPLFEHAQMNIPIRKCRKTAACRATLPRKYRPTPPHFSALGAPGTRG